MVFYLVKALTIINKKISFHFEYVIYSFWLSFYSWLFPAFFGWLNSTNLFDSDFIF